MPCWRCACRTPTLPPAPRAGAAACTARGPTDRTWRWCSPPNGTPRPTPTSSPPRSVAGCERTIPRRWSARPVTARRSRSCSPATRELSMHCERPSVSPAEPEAFPHSSREVLIPFANWAFADEAGPPYCRPTLPTRWRGTPAGDHREGGFHEGLAQTDLRRVRSRVPDRRIDGGGHVLGGRGDQLVGMPARHHRQPDQARDLHPVRQ